MDKYRQAAEMIRGSRSTVILTGAGISTESGIPDFRTPGSGLWSKMDPMEVLSKEVLFNEPKKFYDCGFKLLLSMRNARPNVAHHIITSMEKQGYIDLVVTQNIDNLHYIAKTESLYEVHGNTRTCSCTKCNKSYNIEEVETQVNQGIIPPKCKCGGVIRPDVVLFGDMLPECFQKSVDKVIASDLLIVIGSSLTVSPVNCLADMCKKLIIINIGETPFDHKADIIIREKISVAMKRIAKELVIEHETI